MKLHLPRLLASAVLAAFVAAPAYTAEIPDKYKTILVRDADYLENHAEYASTDYIAFLLEMDIEVPSDISLDGGNLYFTSSNAQRPVSLEFTGRDSTALLNLSSLVFDTLSGLSFTSYKNSAISTFDNLVIQNVTDGVVDSENPDVLFTGNSSSSYGGAIYASSGVSITGNGDVLFTGNSSSSVGGAIYTYSGVSITRNGDVLFTGNSASYGGAIEASSVSITGNGDVTFSGNSASSSYGGAIYAFSGDVSISGNETVCFEKNYERENSTYRLRSIYAGGNLNLSAKTGGHITFHDSVYNGGTTALNADYTDADGKTQQAKGDIIFSGQYTKTHLDAILEANHEGRVATDAEILNSRTSTLGDTTLYGGTLQVLDGAILDTASLSVEAGSRARVLLRDAELKGTAGITFNAGTTLQVQGDSLITGDVLLLAGSSLDIDGAITINGGLTLGQGLTLSGDILADIRNLQSGQSLTLVSGLESLAVQTQELVRSVEYTTVMDGYEVQASEYFSNLAGNTGLVMRYDSEAGTVSICNTPAVPEPTTATLSLLAFAALAARRRRK